MSPSVGLGCTALFLFPFAVVGVVTSILTVQRAGQADWRQAVFFAVFAVTFGGVGFGGFAALLAGKKKLKQRDALEAAHPDSPWLWQTDWASGRIDDNSRAAMLLAWVFTALWNLISVPSGFLGVRAALYEGNRAGYVALIFPIVGAGLMVWAVRLTLRSRKFGVSRLTLSTIPGTIGHTLQGMVQTTSVIDSSEGFRVTLSCIRRVTTQSGKSGSTSEQILWQDDRLVPGAVRHDAHGESTSVPVGFLIPSDARASDSTNPNDKLLWRVQVGADVPGIDYEATFEVPVFRTPVSDQPLSVEEKRLAAETEIDPAKYRQPPGSRIRVATNRRGTEIEFPAARNPSAAAALSLFLVLWTGATGYLIYLRAPIIFPLVSGLFELFILMGVLDLWLEVSRVVVDAGVVTIGTGYLYPGRERTVSAAEIENVKPAIGMRSGTAVYYDIAIDRKGGKRILAGRSVRDKREAEWLAGTIKRALGLEPQVDSSVPARA
jgi:hypothetical protein